MCLPRRWRLDPDGIPFHPGVWALSLAEPPVWTQLVPDGTPPPIGSVDAAAIDDPVRDRLLLQLALGVYPTTPSSVVDVDLWGARATGSGLDSGLRPNPAAGILRLSVTLPDARAAALGAFDASGSLVARRSVEGTGRHKLAVGEDAHLPTGLYLIRLSHAGASVTRRAVVVR